MVVIVTEKTPPRLRGEQKESLSVVQNACTNQTGDFGWFRNTEKYDVYSVSKLVSQNPYISVTQPRLPADSCSPASAFPG